MPSLKGNIFAFGDVAKTGGPKQGRAGMMQGEVVLNNILRLIGNQRILKDYSPLPFEGAIQLTMGTVCAKSSISLLAAHIWLLER